jgi:hypothetical protein
MPDVYMIWDGVPLWIEMKTTSSNRVNLSPQQVELRGPLTGAYFYSRAVVRVLWRLRAYVREPFFRGPRSAKLWTRSEVLVWSIWLESCGPAALRRHKKARTRRAGFLDLEDQDSV